MTKDEIMLLEQSYQRAKKVVHEVEVDIFTSSYPDTINDFFELLSKPPWRTRDYTPDRARSYLENINDANFEEIHCILTYVTRGERFCSGFWASVLEQDTLAPVFERLKVLVEQSEI